MAINDFYDWDYLLQIQLAGNRQVFYVFSQVFVNGNVFKQINKLETSLLAITRPPTGFHFSFPAQAGGLSAFIFHLRFLNT